MPQLCVAAQEGVCCFYDMIQKALSLFPFWFVCDEACSERQGELPSQAYPCKILSKPWLLSFVAWRTGVRPQAAVLHHMLWPHRCTLNLCIAVEAS